VLDEQLETTRELESQDEKRNKSDFALWKNAAPEHIMRWTSPWGVGFPGWHIECSAMSTKYLGEEFDIHGGGMDLQFPHHECEIAQSAVCNHRIPARFWVHNNMITINGRKMGKSYNNVIRLSELFAGTHPLLEQGYSPMTVRFFILQTHYRSTLDFGNEALKAAEKGLKRLWEAFGHLMRMDAAQAGASAADTELDTRCRRLLAECDESMSDDLNTARVLANFFELVPVVNSIRDGQIPIASLQTETLRALQSAFQTYLKDIFGLKEETSTGDGRLNGIMQLLAEIRKDARSRKDFSTSDRIRDRLQELGIRMKDEKDGGVSWSF
jgi:cysteinyl-tRNA synthetase